MVKTEYEFLKFISFMELDKWDYKRYLGIKTISYFSIERLEKHIKEQSKKVKLFEQQKETFGILGISNVIGMFDAYLEIGAKINQPYKKVENNFIAYNPYRVNVGSIGIKTSDLNNKFISPAYVVFSCKKTLLPEYLFLLMKGKKFNKLIKNNTTGSVRQTLSFNSLCNISIPVPQLQIQQKIVSEYTDLVKMVQQYEEEANQLEDSIENILFSELSIKPIKIIPDTRNLKFMNFKDINCKWELDDKMSCVMKSLDKCKYNVIPLGKAVKFINRSWKKKNYKQEKFDYIEIGGIDARTGIFETTKVKTENAPSRATQTVISGDLILGTTRPYLKKFAIVTEEFNDFVCSSGFQVIEKSEKYNLEFVINIIKSDIVIKQFESAMTGALYPAINAEQLKQILIPFPPINIQNKIADNICDLKEKIKANRENAVSLREKAKKDFEEAVFGGESSN